MFSSIFGTIYDIMREIANDHYTANNDENHWLYNEQN